MVVVASDGKIEVTSLEITVWKDREGGTVLTKNPRYESGQFRFPTTLAVLSAGDPAATAVIKVVAYKGKDIVDIRENIVLQVPVDRVAVLPIVLSVNCLSTVNVAEGKSLCGTGKTCSPSTGTCVSSTVAASTLVTYVPGAAVDAAVGVIDTTLDSADVLDSSASDSADSADSALFETLDVVDTLVDSDSAVDMGCGKDTKLCGTLCQPTDIAHGCAAAGCDACPNTNGSASCSAAGVCELTCSSDFKKCGGKCVSIGDPTYGCGPTTCDSSSCPAPGTGTLTCSAGVCVIGICGTNTKKCGSTCVTTDTVNGCAEPGRCTPCGAKEICVGSPAVCTCVSDPLTTTCSGKCGVLKDNCGKDVTCPTCTLPQLCGAGGSGPVDVCGTCNFTSTYPSAPGCPVGNRAWACWPPLAMDATRTSDFVVRTLCGDDVISDTKTKLMWARNEEVGTYSWDNAKAKCVASRRAGFADWRMPTRIELQSLIDHQKATPPTIDDKFQGAIAGSGATAGRMWSASPYAFATGGVWSILFSTGAINTNGLVGDLYGVRCVR